MTEDEAKTKWCPFARVVSMEDHGETAANRYPGDEDANAGTDNCCIGSACMAWRWTDHFDFGTGAGPVPVGHAHVNDPRGKGPFPTNAPGYCGIAGKP